MVEMIPSVQERKKNVYSFMDSYPNLCRLQNTVPNPSIKINNSNKCLDFVGDRLKLDDWKPVLEAISNDRTLHFISIRSRHSKTKVLTDADAENHVQQTDTPKSSPLFTNSILVRITESLSKCLSNSLTLTGLLLEKIPLSSQALDNLIQGLDVCHNLQQLSLPYTQLGDNGCAALCHVLRRRLNLVWLNLSGCNITDNAVNILCNMLKFQKLNRYGESWKQSLRYRPVNPNIMPGLRRLTLNHNPITDSGIKIFFDTLIDDLWLKALDLQHCEITMVGAEDLLNLVKDNEFLSVVDIRGNPQVPNSLVAAIVQQLATNNKGTTPEFQWLPEDNPKLNPKGSSSATTVSRSTLRLSNTTLISKGLSTLSVLPDKARMSRVCQPYCNSSTRSTSVKRPLSANNTPRRPWNWNSASNPSLKRGNSNQMIKANKKPSEDNIILELQSMKKQLYEVSQKLEEERERRMKIESELEIYKQFIDTLKSDNHDSAYQAMFNKFYSAYITSEEQLKPHFNEDVKIETNDSLDSVIKTINEDNCPPDVKNVLNNEEPPLKDSSNVRNNEKINSSIAQQLFETLLSN